MARPDALGMTELWSVEAAGKSAMSSVPSLMSNPLIAVLMPALSDIEAAEKLKKVSMLSSALVSSTSLILTGFTVSMAGTSVT